MTVQDQQVNIIKLLDTTALVQDIMYQKALVIAVLDMRVQDRGINNIKRKNEVITAGAQVILVIPPVTPAPTQQQQKQNV